MSADVWVLVGLVTAALVGVAEVIRRIVWPAVRCVKRLDAFLDDWNGEDARPGSPRRPGIPERLSVLEGRSQATETRLAAIEAHLNDKRDDHA